MSLVIEHSLNIDINLGDSIAVDGCCLTVDEIQKEHQPSNENSSSKSKPGIFSAFAVYDTLKRTSLSKLKIGDKVNLEPALRMGDRIGGHHVQGHVDTVGRIDKKFRRGDSMVFHFSYPAGFDGLVVDEGSIAIDGISLTVKNARKRKFEVAIIPETLKRTKLLNKNPGDIINLEFDILGKYVLNQRGKIREW